MTIRVSLFATCLANQFFADACADSVRLLRHFGVEVDVPEGQTCCGQPAFNSGHREDAARMARHTLEVFRDAEYVVLPSGSCAGMIRCFYPELVDTSEHSEHQHVEQQGTEQLRGLTSRAFELSQFLVDVLHVDTIGTGLAGMRVGYHHGCHALRELGVEREPIQLLEAAGAVVVPWEADQECCGFGGLFSTKMPEVSAAMADRKLDTLPGVDVVTSSDGGCLLQLGGRAIKRSVETPFRHIAQLLWQGVGA